MKETNGRYGDRIAPLALLLLLSLVFFFPVILQGRTFYAFDILNHFPPWASPGPSVKPNNTLISDPVNIFYPSYRFLKESIEKGVLPLWNSANFCGTPFHPPSHPILFLFYILCPVTFAHDLLLWLHLFGTGLFAFLYLKQIGLQPPSSLIASVAWMFNGYVMVWFEFENAPMMALTLPATLYFIERWLKQRDLLLYLLLIGFLALSISVHYAHLLIYQFLFLGIYCLWRCLGPGPEKAGWRGLLGIFLAFVPALVIGANFLTVHLAAFETSQRPEFSFQALFGQIGRLPAKYLVTLLFPDFYGTPISTVCFTPGEQVYNNYNELCIYGGVPTLFLALASLFSVRRAPAGFFLVCAVVTVAMAMGSILYYPMARFVPGLNLSTPTRILYLFGFFLSMLAGLGADFLLRAGPRERGKVLILWSLLAGVALALALGVQTRWGIEWATGHIGEGDPRGPIPSIVTQHFSLLSPALLKPLLLTGISLYLLAAFLFVTGQRARRAFFGLLILVLSFDLISFGLAYNTASPRSLEYPETGAIRLLKKDPSLFRIITYGTFLHNAFAPYGLQDVGGYSSFYAKRYGEYLHLSQAGVNDPMPERYSRWTSFATFGSPLLDLINTTYVLVPHNVHVSFPRLDLIYDREIRVYRNREAFPRLFVVPDYVCISDPRELRRTLVEFTAEDFRKRVVLGSPPPSDFRERSPESSPVPDAEIRVAAYGPNQIEAEVRTEANGFVVIGDNYHPGWRARVDGQETEILRANYIMRAIPVRKGDHRISMYFRPGAILVGFTITVGGWFVLAGVLGVVVFRKTVRGRKGKEKKPI
ncbi:MAG: YfhO family protein [Deltaproteobacteria bacterium]|nr:YfhO family protein [Deltaproteobacteria bacterium]